jgi:hypothetical protein
MKIKKIGSICWLLVICITSIHSQSIEKPNYALKSPETIEILKVETSSLRTVIYLNVENKITGGYFCADKNIFILCPDGTRNNLISSKGIPVCPDTYKFKTIGEKLEFELTFPPLKKDPLWIDLIENCSDNCFSFYGICLDKELNKKIDDASVLVEKKESIKALENFIKIAGSDESKNSGIEGLLYLNIIGIAKETGNESKAGEWYGKLKASSIQRKEAYIKNLNSRGIIY